jgi:hypothetical protein
VSADHAGWMMIIKAMVMMTTEMAQHAIEYWGVKTRRPLPTTAYTTIYLKTK